MVMVIILAQVLSQNGELNKIGPLVQKLVMEELRLDN